MKTLDVKEKSTAAFESDENMLQAFRNRNLMLLGWAALPAMLPISLLHLHKGLYLLSMLMNIVIIVSMINSFSIRSNNRVLISLWFVFALMFITLLVGINVIGESSLYWSYPVFFTIYFLMERSIARIKIIVGLIILIPYVIYLFDFDLAIRFSVTLIILCYFNDVLNGTQTKLYSRMKELIIRDPLTNAFNRRHMNLCIQNVIEESNRGLGPVCLLLMDIDHFKRINDNLGHEKGDQVLKSFVDILHKRQRKIDYVFRAGGEEFVVILRNTELKQAVLIAEEIRKHVEDEEWLENQKVTISIGAAQYLIDESDDEWLKRADDNMYEAKKFGRNRVFPQQAS
ncbi:MAG: GGDEF domain-containing protein [Proteobacteria bacterium]|nr:GGDEF domain-containing protein [Pseudomonadota bacterium]